MNSTELRERIAKKEEEIAKKEKNLVKYAQEVDNEFIEMCDRYFQTKDFTELKLYKLSHGGWCLPEYYSKRYELEDAKETLAKYQKQLEIALSKESTLSEIPEVLKQFRDNLIEHWDSYDIWKRDQIKADYRKVGHELSWYEMGKKWGRGWYDFMNLKTEEIHENNVKAAESLVLGLVNRTVSIAGKITDCQYLVLDRDNQGYSIINGIVIGEKGKARVESIGAGGYNIQRYHIRVLVKEVR